MYIKYIKKTQYVKFEFVIETKQLLYLIILSKRLHFTAVGNQLFVHHLLRRHFLLRYPHL